MGLDFSASMLKCGTNRLSGHVAFVQADALRIMKDAYVLMKGACGLDMYGADVAHQNPGSQVALGGMGVDASIEVSDQLGGMQVVTLNIATVIG